MRLTRPTFVCFLVLLLLLVACQSERGVGDESLLDFEEKEQQRLGAKSPAPSPPPPSPAVQGKQGVGQTQAPPKPEEAPPFQIAINSDSAGSAFDPSVARVSRGTKVAWVNRDQVARSVEADDGSFKSGSIAPGETWTWQASKSGRINYHDGTRPYAVGAVEVA